MCVFFLAPKIAYLGDMVAIMAHAGAQKWVQKAPTF